MDNIWTRFTFSQNICVAFSKTVLLLQQELNQSPEDMCDGVKFDGFVAPTFSQLAFLDLNSNFIKDNNFLSLLSLRKRIFVKAHPCPPQCKHRVFLPEFSIELYFTQKHDISQNLARRVFLPPPLHALHVQTGVCYQLLQILSKNSLEFRSSKISKVLFLKSSELFHLIKGAPIPRGLQKPS